MINKLSNQRFLKKKKYWVYNKNKYSHKFFTKNFRMFYIKKSLALKELKVEGIIALSFFHFIFNNKKKKELNITCGQDVK